MFISLIFIMSSRNRRYDSGHEKHKKKQRLKVVAQTQRGALICCEKILVYFLNFRATSHVLFRVLQIIGTALGQTTGKETEIPWFPRNNRPPAIAQPWPVIAGALFRERHRSHSHRTTQSHTPRTEAPHAHALKRQALGSHS